MEADISAFSAVMSLMPLAEITFCILTLIIRAMNFTRNQPVIALGDTANLELKHYRLIHTYCPIFSDILIKCPNTGDFRMPHRRYLSDR